MMRCEKCIKYEQCDYAHVSAEFLNNNCPNFEDKYLKKYTPIIVREIIDIIDYITGAEYDNHNEVEVAFMQGAKKVRSEIVKKYHIDEQLVTKDKRNT